jgi:hypothetical protein
MRLYRTFRLGGNATFEPLLEVFNVFNRGNFTAWVLDESNASFGQPRQATGIAYQPRVIQLGFRARF